MPQLAFILSMFFGVIHTRFDRAIEVNERNTPNINLVSVLVLYFVALEADNIVVLTCYKILFKFQHTQMKKHKQYTLRNISLQNGQTNLKV